MRGDQRLGAVPVRRAAAAAAVAVWALSLTPLPGPSASAQQGERPNVLIILTDDQRIESMGPMRRTRALFKRGGTEFVNAYATTPLCCPSRASILTGRYAHNHRVRTNPPPPRRDPQPPPPGPPGDPGAPPGLGGKSRNRGPRPPPLFGGGPL